jgi:excisionase family DNA binding protein
MTPENNPHSFTEIPPLLKAEQVADLLNVSLAYAYRLMQSGQIPTLKLGRAVRVQLEDLQSYIRQNLKYKMDAS